MAAQKTAEDRRLLAEVTEDLKFAVNAGGVVTKDFDDRETAAVGLCFRLIEAMRSRHRAGILDAAAQAESWLQRNYGDLQRSAAPAALVRRR